MVIQFTTLVIEFEINGSINRIINGGAMKSFTQKNLAFDFPSFQHHFKEIKSLYAGSVARSKDQDNQA
tara:strand:+ start:656 stop:859 length:204 start_codon:yes stop_codon:yes gene_type:complete